MKQLAAPTGLSIKIVTISILLLTGGMLIGAFFIAELLWSGTFLAVICLFCYLTAPIAYELGENHLTIISRLNRKVFSPVLKCSLIDNEKPSFSIRLWGNGGLFAGTGIFWNKKYGIFKAYVTTGEKSYLTMVETSETKVIITPENPKKFVDYT